MAIFESLSALGKREVKALPDVLPLLECVECLKAVMNSESGLDCVIRSGGESFVNRLVLSEYVYNVSGNLVVYGGGAVVCNQVKAMNTITHGYLLLHAKLDDHAELAKIS